MPPWMYSEKQPCGTYEAYRQHLYRKEPACVPCKEARRRYWHEHESPKGPRRRHAANGGPTGWQPGMAVDVFGLLDFCEAIVPEWERERAMGAEF